MILAAWGSDRRWLRRLPSGATTLEGTGWTLAFAGEGRAFADDAVMLGTSLSDGRHLGELGGGYCVARVRDGLELGRGPAWSPPLYYVCRRDGVIASSRLELLVEDERPDLGRLASLLTYCLGQDDDRTAFEGVRRVRPFEMLTTRGPRVERRPGIVRVAQAPRAPADELAHRLRTELDLATASAARGHAKVAVMVGGIDSCSVLASASTVGPLAVTLDLRGPGADLPYVTSLARRLSLACEVVTPEACRPLVAPHLVVDAAPAIHTGDALELGCAARARALGATVLLSGNGGDEVFGGDFGAAYAMLARRGAAHRVLRGLRAPLPWSPTRRQRVREIVASVARPAVPAWLRRLRARVSERRWYSWIGPIARRELAVLRRAPANIPSPWSAQDRYDALARSPRIGQGAEEREQMGIASGLRRVDVPFDDRLVRFVCALPPDALFEGDAYRGLLRRAMRDALPADILARDDKAEFEVATAALMMPLPPDLLEFRRLARTGLIDRAEMLREIRPVLDTPTSHEAAFLWGTVSAAIAIERFLELRGVTA